MNPRITRSLLFLAVVMFAFISKQSPSRQNPPATRPIAPIGALYRDVVCEDLSVAAVVVNTTAESIRIARVKGTFYTFGDAVFTSSGEHVRPSVNRVQRSPFEDEIVELKPGEVVVGNVNALRDYFNLKPGTYYALLETPLFRKEEGDWSPTGRVRLGLIAFELEEGEGRRVELEPAGQRPVAPPAPSTTTSPATRATRGEEAKRGPNPRGGDEGGDIQASIISDPAPHTPCRSPSACLSRSPPR